MRSSDQPLIILDAPHARETQQQNVSGSIMRSQAPAAPASASWFIGNTLFIGSAVGILLDRRSVSGPLGTPPLQLAINL